MVYIFLAKGFEEIEAISVVDILRRAEILVKTVSISEQKVVVSARGVEVNADILINEISAFDADMIILPGGALGVENLKQNEAVKNLIISQNTKNKYIGAICAGPTILGMLGVLEGKKAICYPGCEGQLKGAVITNKDVVIDENIITSKGVSTAILFALEIVKILKCEQKYNAIKNDIGM